MAINEKEKTKEFWLSVAALEVSLESATDTKNDVQLVDIQNRAARLVDAIHALRGTTARRSSHD